MPRTLAGQYEELGQRINTVVTIERRISAWMLGWGMIVLAAFITKLFVEAVPWWSLAAIAGFQTGLFWLLYLVSVYRYRSQARRRTLERAYAQQQAAASLE